METPILKPLSIAELLDKALQIYKRHAGLLLSIVAVVLIPTTIISSISIYFMDDTRLVDVGLGAFVSPFAELAALFAISSLYLGKNANLQTSFSEGSKGYWSRFGAAFVMGLALIPAGVIVFGMSLAGCPGLVGILFIVPLVVFLSTRWSLSTSAIVIERVGAMKGLERSWNLTQGFFWRVFGTSFAASLLSILLSTIPSLFVGYLLETFLSGSPKLVLILSTVTEQLTLILASPLTYGVNVLIYYDLRIRKEGFDLEFMAGEQGEVS